MRITHISPGVFPCNHHALRPPASLRSPPPPHSAHRPPDWQPGLCGGLGRRALLLAYGYILVLTYLSLYRRPLPALRCPQSGPASTRNIYQQASCTYSIYCAVGSVSRVALIHQIVALNVASAGTSIFSNSLSSTLSARFAPVPLSSLR